MADASGAGRSTRNRPHGLRRSPELHVAGIDNEPLAALVSGAAALRGQLAGRFPHSVPWRFHEFVLGTVTMTWQERGVYMGLLWRQFDKGSLPTSVDELAHAVGMEPAAFEPVWRSKLAEKFSEHDGRLYNVTMLREWTTQAQYLLRERARSRRS